MLACVASPLGSLILDRRGGSGKGSRNPYEVRAGSSTTQLGSTSAAATPKGEAQLTRFRRHGGATQSRCLRQNSLIGKAYDSYL